MHGPTLKRMLTIALVDVDFDPDTISDEYYDTGPNAQAVALLLQVTRDPEVLARLAVLLAEML